MKIGGEYRRDGGPDRVRREGQVIFLRKLEALAPDVPSALLGDVLPVYMDAFRATAPRPDAAPAWTLWRWERGDWDGLDTDDQPELGRLRTALLSWGDRFNLTDPWMLDVALRTLTRRASWEREHADQEPWGGMFISKLKNSEEEPTVYCQHIVHDRPPEPQGFADPPFFDMEVVAPFVFEHPGWNSTWTLWADFEQAVYAALSQELKAYRRRHVERAEAEGLKPGVQKKSRRGKDPLLHFDWLVQFQVHRHRIEKIAEHYKKDPRSVRDAIRTAAKVIGLTRRSI